MGCPPSRCVKSEREKNAMTYLRSKPILHILIAFTAAEVFRHIGWMLFYEQFLNNPQKDINIGFIYYTMAITVTSFTLPRIINRLSKSQDYQLMETGYAVFFALAFLLRVVMIFLPLNLAYIAFFFSTAAIMVCIMICFAFAFQIIPPNTLGRFAGIAYFADAMILTITEYFTRTALYFPVSIAASGLLCLVGFFVFRNQAERIRLSMCSFPFKPLSATVFRLGIVVFVLYVVIAGLTDNLYFFEEAFELPSINRYIMPITGVMYLLNGFLIDKIDRKISFIVAFVLICTAQSMNFFIQDGIFGLAYTLISNMGSTFLELSTLIAPMVYMRKRGIPATGIGEGIFYGSFCITSILFLFLNADAHFPIMGIILLGGIICLILLIVAIIIIQDNELMESQLRLQQIRIEHQNAVIFSLKKQINAHFTVNSLNSVRALIKKKENDRAAEICDGLSGLLQYANAGDETIAVLDEFSMLERYLAIMHARYPNKFTANLEFDDELADVKIPRMLLQPVVENAILHGFRGENIGEINILCEIKGKTVRLSVNDNGCGINEKVLETLREDLRHYSYADIAQGLSHVALPNIQKRIQTDFGSDFGVTIESEQGKGTSVTLILPIFLPEERANENR